MNSPCPRPLSPPSPSTDARTTSHSRPLQSPATHAHSKRYSEPGTQRQRRLLQNRNAKFPAKKLSLSNLSSRFSQLIHANDEPVSPVKSDNDQENVPMSAHEIHNNTKRHSSGSSLGILDEITNTSVRRKVRKSINIAIHEDNSSPQRPLLERSPFSSPATYQDTSSQGASPLGFDHIQDNLGTMRLREISGNEWRGSPLTHSPWNGPIKTVKQRKSFHVKSDSDTQEYIEHIEKELQAAKKEISSPTSNKSLREQLRSTHLENERLREDINELRITLEGEVKRSIEHRTEMEVELKRRVKTLEEELEQKDTVIRDLELQHDERRLNFSTIDTLKTAIERLEHEKLNLEDENRSITKRNEVLSELLAMSPTKMQSFELRSPTRERRGGRPMSMIIPRQPTSPSGRLLSHPPSAAASPSVSSCGPFFGRVKSRAGSSQLSTSGLGLSGAVFDSVSVNSSVDEQTLRDQYPPHKRRSRRSTNQSEDSVSDTGSMLSKTSSPIDSIGQRVLPKRKPRKFMSGSTQLKPLLLPALAGDVSAFPSSAVPSPQVECAPRFQPAADEQVDYFPSDLIRPGSRGPASALYNSLSMEGSAQDSEYSVRAYQTMEDIVAGQVRSQTSAPSSPSAFDDTLLDRHIDTNGSDELVNRVETSASQDFETSVMEDNAKSSPDQPYDSLSHYPYSSSPQLRELDLVALNNLGLPDPDYDVLPSAAENVDDSLLTEIPRPLFSLSGLQSQLSHRLIENATNAEICPRDSRRKSWGVDDTRPLARTYNETDLISSKHNYLPPQLIPQTIRERHGSQPASENVPQRTAGLPKRSSLRSIQLLDSRRNSLEVLCSSKFAGRPLASFAIRTLFQTISRCTKHVRDFKRDPLALARRVLANAWFSNWKLFGRLSWWVLGLFMSPSFGGPKLKKWEWDNYDGEEIARRACQGQLDEGPGPELNLQHPYYPIHRFSPSEQRSKQEKSGTTEKIGWKESITLWGKFSMAIMLAIGGAVVKGPGEMLKEIEGTNSTLSNTTAKDSQEAELGQYQHEPHSTDFHPCYPPDTYNDQQHSLLPAYRRSIRRNLPPSVSRPIAIIDHRSDTAWSPSQVTHANEEETLRAVKSPRKHVAGYFGHAYSNSGIAYQSTGTGCIHGQSLNSSIEIGSPDGRNIPWSRTAGSQSSNYGQSFRRGFF